MWKALDSSSQGILYGSVTLSFTIQARMASSVPTTALLPASLCLAMAALACIVYQNRRKTRMPLREGGKIKKILIYPIKSVSGIEVDTADLVTEGLVYKTLKDRYFIFFRFFHRPVAIEVRTLNTSDPSP